MNERKPRCPHDGGACNHSCEGDCWRKHACGPIEPPHPGFPRVGNRPVWQMSTNGAHDHICPRRKIAEETSTRDPIFLFQRRRVIYFVNHVGFEWPEGWTTDDDGGLFNADGETLDHQDAVEAGCAEFHWETEAVFATREETKAHGEARPYAWGKEGEGWRTYAVPCHGQLAELLVIHWKEKPKS